MLEEITALREAGASTHLLTSFARNEGDLPDMPVKVAPLDATLRDSGLRWRPARVAINLSRTWRDKVAAGLRPEWNARHRVRALRQLAPQTDLFWVVDFPSLPSVIEVAEGTPARVVYETVDLVPEYLYFGDEHRLRAIAQERRLISQVDGFITACDSYADYYVEMYGPLLSRRPVVRDNMPASIVSAPKPTSKPLRLLFLGSLMNDRPILELLEAVAMSKSGATLTLQGKNYLGDDPQRWIDSHGLGGQVRLLEPCPPESLVETAAAYDVGIVALRGVDENERRASTSKLFTYMAAGLAVLGSDLPGIARIVNQYDNGLLVKGMGAQAWANAIDEITSRPEPQIDAMKRRSLEGASEHSWAKQKPAFIAEFARALEHKV